MYFIEPISTSDFDCLWNIEQQAHALPWSMGTLKNNQGERYINLKISDHQQIIGFAICQYVLEEATLFNLAITPTFQGKGLGKLLLQQLIANLRQQNIQTLWLEVRHSNQKAFNLYSSLGFNEVDIRKNYYPTQDHQREDAIVMALYL